MLPCTHTHTRERKREWWQGNKQQQGKKGVGRGYQKGNQSATFFWVTARYPKCSLVNWIRALPFGSGPKQGLPLPLKPKSKFNSSTLRCPKQKECYTFVRGLEYKITGPSQGLSPSHILLVEGHQKRKQKRTINMVQFE